MAALGRWLDVPLPVRVELAGVVLLVATGLGVVVRLVVWRVRDEDRTVRCLLVRVAGLAGAAEPAPVWQLALTLCTADVPGGSMLIGAVPGGALTAKVSVVPLSKVAVTTHWSAEATGTASTPVPRRAAAIRASRHDIFMPQRYSSMTPALPRPSCPLIHSRRFLSPATEV